MPPLLKGMGILSLAAALILAVGFAIGRWPLAFDRAAMIGLRDGLPTGLRPAALFVTHLGDGTTLTWVVLAAALLLALGRHYLTALATVAAATTGGWMVTLIKHLVGRPRPTVIPHWTSEHDLSFPSGHSASSAVVYLTLAALATQVIARPAWRRFVLAAAAILVTAIGLSRVYLGVHWPTDVLAGWSLGTAWAIGWWEATAVARGSLRPSLGRK